MSETGIKGRDKWLYPTVFVESNYLSLPLIHVSGTQVLIYIYIYIYVCVCVCVPYPAVQVTATVLKIA